MSRPHTRPSTSFAGFALFEATAALFVAAVGLFGVVQMFAYGADKLDAIHEQDLAGRILQNELETLRGKPFDALKTGQQLPFISDPPELDHLPNATLWVEIRDHEDLGDTLRQITAHVRWTTENGRPAHRQLATYFARGMAHD